jgi:hypothetical protein
LRATGHEIRQTGWLRPPPPSLTTRRVARGIDSTGPRLVWEKGTTRRHLHHTSRAGFPLSRKHRALFENTVARKWMASRDGPSGRRSDFGQDQGVPPIVSIPSVRRRVAAGFDAKPLWISRYRTPDVVNRRDSSQSPAWQLDTVSRPLAGTAVRDAPLMSRPQKRLCTPMDIRSKTAQKVSLCLTSLHARCDVPMTKLGPQVFSREVNRT